MQQKQSGFGIASLVLGIFGMLTAVITIGIIPSIVGLILGCIGVSQKNRSKGTAIAGLVCSIIGILIVGIVCFILWFKNPRL